MACNPVTTYSDLLLRAQDYLGQTVPEPASQRDCRRAIQAAFRELAAFHRWTLYYQEGQLNTQAPYSTGTIAYLQSSGAFPRQVTLTGGTWPSWAPLGMLQIGPASFEIAGLIDSVTLQLSVNNNPGADIAGPQPYVLCQDQYDLPADFVSSDCVHTPVNWGGLEYVHPRDWKSERTLVVTQAIPRFYTFIGSRRSFNTLCMAFYPAPDQSYGLTYIYQRRPRPLVTDQYRDGTVTTAASSTTIIGTNTAFTSKMVNAIIRIAADATDWPTGPDGSVPSVYERTVAAVNSPTSLTVDSATATVLTNVNYEISDPVDVEDGAMLNALQRGIEKQLATVRKAKTSLADANANYRDALAQATSGDQRTNVLRGVGWENNRLRLRMKNMPLGPDS